MLKRCQLFLHTGRLLSNAVRTPLSATYEDTSHKYFLDDNQIEGIKKSLPILSNVSLDVWREVHNLFSEYGFKTKNFLQIISDHPTLLIRPAEKLHESLELWRGCQFGENRVEHLILRYPQFLEVLNDRKMRIQINTLQSIVGTPKNIWMLLMNSPNLIQESPKIIEEKFDYMEDVMRLEISEIAKSEAFSFSLDEIKMRHVFLERLGLFKRRSLKAKPGEILKNPRLYQIMDKSEDKFVAKVAMVSMSEYEAFTELYKRELDSEKSRNTNDESSEEEY